LFVTQNEKSISCCLYHELLVLSRYFHEAFRAISRNACALLRLYRLPQSLNL